MWQRANGIGEKIDNKKLNLHIFSFKKNFIAIMGKVSITRIRAIKTYPRLNERGIAILAGRLIHEIVQYLIQPSKTVRFLTFFAALRSKLAPLFMTAQIRFYQT
ncbi:MAG: hypothetical protein Q7T54_03625 [Candidatus Levybacteria bacterium]|nr:hypothetical protein [Candidatus Levybacteria bacterium]